MKGVAGVPHPHPKWRAEQRHFGRKLIFWCAPSKAASSGQRIFIKKVMNFFFEMLFNFDLIEAVGYRARTA